jgi:ER membrane protein complex subunit 3
MSDPAAMDGMMAGMKTQMVMMVPQMVIMGWINFFFQGFVLSEYYFRTTPYLATDAVSLVKLPFPLTLGFKSMLQRGIETPDMDVRWVSSLSWYFLNFFGLNGLYRLILGGDNSQSFLLLAS